MPVKPLMSNKRYLNNKTTKNNAALINGSAVRPLLSFINPVRVLLGQPFHSVSQGTRVPAATLEPDVLTWVSLGVPLSQTSRLACNMADRAVGRDT